MAARSTPAADGWWPTVPAPWAWTCWPATPRVASVHPLVALPTPSRVPSGWRGAWFGVAGDPLAARGGRGPRRARGRGRRRPTGLRYHAAAVIASNHLVALLGQVERVAATVGVPLEAYLDAGAGHRRQRGRPRPGRRPDRPGGPGRLGHRASATWTRCPPTSAPPTGRMAAKQARLAGRAARLVGRHGPRVRPRRARCWAVRPADDELLMIAGAVERPLELIRAVGPSPRCSLASRRRAPTTPPWLPRRPVPRVDSPRVAGPAPSRARRLRVPSAPTRCWDVKDVVPHRGHRRARPDSVRTASGPPTACPGTEAPRGDRHHIEDLRPGSTPSAAPAAPSGWCPPWATSTTATCR